MASWLSRIDPRRRKTPVASQTDPQPYEVICRCGQRTLGIRMPMHQQVMCKQCGETLFVLPRNVYPAPPPPVPDPVTPDVEEEIALEEAAAVEAKRKADGLLGELADESRGQTQKSKREQEELKKLRELRALKAQLESKKSRRSRKKDAKAEKAKKKELLAKENEEAQNNPLTARVPLRERLRKQVTPFRLIVASALLLIMGTAWWQARASRIESARLRFDTSRKEALELLESGDLQAAEPLLTEAADAADLVDRQDEAATRIRRLRLETNTLNNLAQNSIFDAVSSATAADREDMASVLMTEIGDRWIVLDTWVRPLKRIDGELIEYSVDIPILMNDVLVQGRVETEAFSVFELDRNGAATVFAAKIASCDVVGRKDQRRLSIRFDGDSIRLWANKVTYQTLGFSDDEMPLHLDKQATALGVRQ